MCGRYAATKKPSALAAEFDAFDALGADQPAPDYNVAPTKDAIIVVQRHPRDEDGTVLSNEPAERSLRLMRWGLVPFWAKEPSAGSRMVNTRAETVHEKPAFRKALARHRCLIPADGWFEWRQSEPGGKSKGKQPFFMTSTDSSSVAFAGIWETWRDPKADKRSAPLVTFSILTTDAVGQLTEIHPRMPLVLPKRHWDSWLDPDRDEVSDLLAPPSTELVDALELRPISSKVNNVRNNGPELVERAAPDEVDLDAAEQRLF